MYYVKPANSFFVAVELLKQLGVSTAKGGETTEGSSIASNEATVGVSTILELFEIT